MNMQTNIIHVKVSGPNGEWRRFSTQTFDFEQLEATLRKLFSLSSCKIHFKDDEDDWVLMSTDEEFKYAAELTGNPLRLQVKATPEQVKVEPEEPHTVHVRGERGRGGRGGRKFHSHPHPVVMDRLQKKRDRITGKISELEEELKNPELNSERERVLLWKVEKLKNKLAFVTQRQQCLETRRTEDGNEDEDPADSEGWRRRGHHQLHCSSPYGGGFGPYSPHPPHGHGGRGRGRGRGMHKFGGPQGEDQSPMDSEAAREAIKKCSQMKAGFKVACKSGDVQAVTSYKHDLKQARRMKKQAVAILLSTQMAKKRDCWINLKKAKQSGDETHILQAEEALAQAIIDFKKAKKELKA